MKAFKTFALLSSLVIAIAACGSTNSEQLLGLDGSEWVLVQIDGEATLPGSKTTLIFEVDRIYGSGGCNNYFASYTLGEDSDIKFGPTGSTMMFCPDPEGVMDQEFSFLKILAEVSRVSMEGGLLILKDEVGSSRLVFNQILAD